MATFAIGDIHGCYRTLRKLVRRLPFDAKTDRLWLVGDLVNRGPDSLAVLRWVRDLGERMGERLQVVQGNHDLHLQAIAAGLARHRADDTLHEILRAKDGPELIDWLGRRPLLVRDGKLVMVHAGLLPTWTLDEAEGQARKVEKALQGVRRPELLTRLDPPGLDAKGQRLRRSLAALTRLRTCTLSGTLTGHKGPPRAAPPGELAWFDVPGRRSSKAVVVFGHWAALGLYVQPGIVGLDSGAAWGGHLTAIRLDDGKIYQQRARETI